MNQSNLMSDMLQLGARLETYGELELPSQFSDPRSEAQALREHWGVYDQSHLGRLRVRGADRVAFLHNLTTNDVKSMRPGQGHETVIPTVKGRILDRGSLYCLEGAFLLVTQPTTRQEVLKHLEFYHFMEEVEFDDLTDTSGLLEVSGPASASKLDALLGTSLASTLPAGGHAETQLGDLPVRLLRHDRFGSAGFRLWSDARAARSVYRALVTAGAIPVGETALDWVRVNHGEPAFGKELDGERNPLEAGLYESLSFTKGCYLGQEVIARLDTYRKVARFLVQLQMGPEAEPELTGRPRLLLEGQEVGWLSSWVPNLDGPGFRALGYTSRRCQGVLLSINGRAPARVGATLTTAEGDGGPDLDADSCH
jgi:tRNA-modifying protein YgfZ